MKYLFFIVAFCFSTLAYAEDITIEMLNKLEKRSMVFSQELVKVDVGDTVFWKATDPGHNVEFISKNGVPEGVEKFKSKVGKDAEYTFSIPGIYAYWCTPHKTMGMIGFVVVGDDYSNIDSINQVKFIGKSKKIAEPLLAQLQQ
ncbi:MAG: Pseudoazurin [Alphaproteobacteria bacterium MarineAlpha5_Bin9]|nr:MAG: Pseudoazurin [Alphaproteobacteria bacterium MarineAlpha5_Bin9]|tara:strand:+ start:1917 stop:2348 length:432 start_codon:yes stop_codon:yes gene_type:complete